MIKSVDKAIMIEIAIAC